MRVPAAVGQHAEHSRNFQRIINLALLLVGLSHDDERRPGLAVKKPLHRSESNGLVGRDLLALPVAGREDLQDAENAAGDHAGLYENTSVLRPLTRKQVKRADCGHHEASRNRCAAHVVRVLPPCPGIQDELPEAGELRGTIGRRVVADGVLHPGVGRDNEKARQPRPDKDRHRGEPVHDRTQPFFAVEEQSQERRFQEESEHAFHTQRLADHSAREFREMRPVGAELEFHGNSGHHAQYEIDPEDFGPEAGGLVIDRIVPAQRDGLQPHDQQRQTHRQLREQIVEGDGKGKMKSVNNLAIHKALRPACSIIGTKLRAYVMPVTNRPEVCAAFQARHAEFRGAARRLRSGASRHRSRGQPAGRDSGFPQHPPRRRSGTPS